MLLCMQSDWESDLLKKTHPKVDRENLCELYGHEHCTAVETSPEADLVLCSCVCHSKPEAYA